MIDYFESLLYVISMGLLYPVIIGLVILTLWVVLYTGNFVGEALERRKNDFKRIDSFLKLSGSDFKLNVRNSPYPDIEILKAIRKWEERRLRNLNLIRFVVRLGPSIGLMGTLIPMGTALASLSQGDMLAMSANMVTAFTTTIVGIGCGTVAYLVTLTKESWLRKDLQACEIYGEQLAREIQSLNNHKVTKHQFETVQNIEN
jgi:hypothetical protein